MKKTVCSFLLATLASSGLVYSQKLYAPVTNYGERINVISLDVPTGDVSVVSSSHLSDNIKRPGETLHKIGSEYYGFGPYSGVYGSGSFYRWNFATKTMTDLYGLRNFGDFQEGQVIVGSAVKGNDLYYITYLGGSENKGVLGKLNTVTNTLTVLYHFDEHPSAIAIKDDNVWIVNTVGVYSYSLTSNDFSLVQPLNTSTGLISSALLYVDGENIYGNMLTGGTHGFGGIFCINTSTNTYTLLHNALESDGYNATAFCEMGDDLYISFLNGGAFYSGTLGRFNKTTGVFTLLNTFTSSDLIVGYYPNSLFAYEGDLYGFCRYGGYDGAGTLFKYVISSGVISSVLDLGDFQARDMISGYDIVGNTLITAAHSLSPFTNRGALVSVDLTDFDLTMDYRFGQAPEGKYMYGTLTPLNDRYYGSIASSNDIDVSGIGAINPLSGAFDAVFKYTDPTTEGKSFYGTLATDGTKLYGITVQGGIDNHGTIYSFDPSTSVFTNLYQFDYTNGRSPQAGLIKVDNKLYGVTAQGGSLGGGVLYAFDLLTNTIEVLHNESNGLYCLPVFHGNKLYGLSTYAGDDYAGALYQYDLVTNAYEVLHYFDYDTEGAYPFSQPIFNDGKMYITMSEGGQYGIGTIVAYDVASNEVETLHHFYDTNFGGAGRKKESAKGKIKPIMHPMGTAEKTDDGASPYSDLFFVGTKAYGLSTTGGLYNGGTIYSYDIATHVFEKIYDLNYYGNEGGGHFLGGFSTADPLPTGLNGNALLHNITLYPNPSQGQLAICLPFQENAPIDYTLMSQEGRILMHGSVDLSQTQTLCNIASLDAGTYLVAIRTSEGTIVKRIVKM